MLRKAWVFMRLVWPLVVRRSQTRSLLAMCAFGVFSASASADVVVVPYTGTFNEAASAPGGDYDNIGGLLDVGLFNLVAGNNTFIGAVHTPADSSDAFAIGVGPDQTLVGASLTFGTNLSTSLHLFKAPGPNWSLEESDATPTVFEIDNLGTNGGSTPTTYAAPSFSRGEGIYTVTLGNGTFVTTPGNGPVAYSMTFIVQGPGTNSVPEPGALTLVGVGLAALSLKRRRRENSRRV